MSPVRVLLTDFLRAFYAPRALYRDIREGRATPSWLCVLVYCLVYVVGTLWLYLHHAELSIEPWLRLDPARYYLFEMYYLTPLIFLMWILGAGIIRVLGRLVGGQGRFEVLLRMTGYALWAPWYPLIVVDIIHATPQWLYNSVLVACMILILVGTTIAIKIEEQIGLVYAAVIALLTFGTIGVLTFTFIR